MQLPKGISAEPNVRPSLMILALVSSARPGRIGSMRSSGTGVGGVA